MRPGALRCRCGRLEAAVGSTGALAVGAGACVVGAPGVGVSETSGSRILGDE